MRKLLIAGGLVALGLGAWLVMRGDWPPLGAHNLTAAIGSLKGRSSGEPGAYAQNPSAGQPAARSVAVEAIGVTSATSTTDLRAIGTLQSEESVQISSEIAGRVTEIAFKEGEPVAAGAILVKLDDALVAAEVADAEARFSFAATNLARANSLARSGNVTERARDEATANSETARAALELAKVRLSKHVIKAPFAGVVGIRKVSPGAYVTAGQPIVNIEKIDTLKVDFKLPELVLADIRTGQPIEVTVDALPERTFEGTIYAIDPLVDVNGRALSVRAKLANPDGVLRPGLFARILIRGTRPRSVVVIPESAIVPRGADKIVYAIEDGKAVEAKVTLGERKNGLVEVIDGIGPGAMVVTAGQQKLKNGSPVDVIARESAAERGRGS